MSEVQMGGKRDIKGETWRREKKVKDREGGGEGIRKYIIESMWKSNQKRK